MQIEGREGSGTADSTGSSTATTGTDSTDSTTGATCMMDVPDGGSCAEDCECESEKCFQVPVLGGLCGECTEDADCPEGGCSIPNPLASTGSTCNMGELGGGCETTEVCQEGLQCELVLDVAGIITALTCSECGADTDCGGETPLCTIQYDVSNFKGQKVCVAASSVPDGEGCDLAGSGDMACTSGNCNEVDIMGLATLGICGQCEADEDCGQGETCSETNVDITTGVVTPSTCVAG